LRNDNVATANESIACSLLADKTTDITIAVTSISLGRFTTGRKFCVEYMGFSTIEEIKSTGITDSVLHTC